MSERAREVDEAPARQAVAEYLRELGASDAALVQEMVEQILARARLRVADTGGEELKRRAIEETLRRVDRELDHAFGPGRMDPHALAGVRAAMMLGAAEFPVDAGLRGVEVSAESRVNLLAVLPRPFPEEIPQPLVHQHFEFLGD